MCAKYISKVESLDEIETRAYKCGLQEALEILQTYPENWAYAVQRIGDAIRCCEKDLEGSE